jgi:dihydroneopterin aldolase
MIGRIGLEGLKVDCKIGVYPEERVQERQLVVEIVVEADLSDAIESDSVEDTVNYQEVADLLTAHVRGREFHLLERLASEWLDLLFSRLDISWGWIRVKKCQPILDLTADLAFVELERFREGEFL